MSEFQIMNFSSSSSLTKEKGVLTENESHAGQLDPAELPSGFTMEQTLKQNYMNLKSPLSPIMTEVPDGSGGTGTKIEILQGLIFPASELRELLGNQSERVDHLYIEFCYHKVPSSHPYPERKIGHSLILTGLDKNDKRIKNEGSESRVYEFAQSCPSRCPNG